MSGNVDLSQIRGDWHFHINYLSNAMHQTLKRAVKMWGDVEAEADPAIGQVLAKLDDAWKRLEATGNGTDRIDVGSPVLNEVLELMGQTKGPCDAMEEEKGLGGSASIYDLPMEHFTEAVRQVRSYHDDFVMMRDQKP